jgi:hypothetical protein
MVPIAVSSGSKPSFSSSDTTFATYLLTLAVFVPIGITVISAIIIAITQNDFVLISNILSLDILIPNQYKGTHEY